MATKDILMDGDKVCIAWFRKKQIMLTTSVDPIEGGGTITPASGKVNKGTTVTIEAIPDIDHDFDHFTVNGEEVPPEEAG